MAVALTPRQRAHREWKQAVITAHRERVPLCLPWRDKFKNFLASMGDPPPGMKLRRRVASKGFTPENCQWS